MGSVMEGKFLLYSTASSKHIEHQIKADNLFAPNEYEVSQFPNGEPSISLRTPVAGKHIVIISATVSDDDLLTLYRLGWTIHKYRARSLTIIIPCFGGATKDRTDKDSLDCVTAKAHADLISAIPEMPYGNHVAILDCHTEGLPGYFANSVRGDHWYCETLILEMIRRAAANADFVLVSADAGRAAWVSSYAAHLDVPTTALLKVRTGAHTTVTQMTGDFRGKKVFIYDDYLRTGSTALGAMKQLMQLGAKSGSIFVSHGDFCGDVLDRARSIPGLEHLYCLDTHPKAVKAHNSGLYEGFLEVQSVSPLILNKLKEVAKSLI